MPVVLPELVWFALLLFSFAVVYAARHLVEALFKPIIAVVGSIPGLGGALSGVLSKIEQAISDAFGVVESKIDTAIGTSWHLTARYMDELWHAVENHSRDILTLAELVAPFGSVIAAVKNTAHAVEGALHGIEHGVRDLRQLWHGIEARVKQLEHDLTRGIGHDLRLSLKADEKALAHLEHKVIPALRGDVATAEGEIGNLYDWAKGKADLIGIGTFAVAVSAALASLGFGWLKCPQLNALNNKRGCGLWSVLDKLIGLAGLLVIGFDFEEFVDAAEIVANGIGDAVAGIEGSFPLALPPLPPPE